MGKKKRKYDKGASVGFLMALPTVLGLILLNIYPLCRTVYMSFFKSGAFGKWTFVGLDNYVTMFQSAGFWTVTKNTLLFMLLTVPVTVVLGLLIAVLLNQSINGKTAFRAIYFLPMVVAPAAVAMVWKWLFNAEYGIINIVLGALHLPSKIQWISDPKTALLACAIVTIWSSVGLGKTDSLFALVFPALVSAFGTFFLRQTYMGIPDDLLEAARIDGCGHFRSFISIAFPLTKTAMAALAVFTALFAYGDLMWPLIVNTKLDKLTLSSGLSTLRGQFSVNYPNLMAGSVLAMIPMIIIYIIFQRQFIEGIALTGTKA